MAAHGGRQTSRMSPCLRCAAPVTPCAWAEAAMMEPREQAEARRRPAETGRSTGGARAAAPVTRAKTATKAVRSETPEEAAERAEEERRARPGAASLPLEDEGGSSPVGHPRPCPDRAPRDSRGNSDRPPGGAWAGRPWSLVQSIPGPALGCVIPQPGVWPSRASKRHKLSKFNPHCP